MDISQDPTIVAHPSTNVPGSADGGGHNTDDTRRCANCNSVGHDLAICVGPPGFDGAIHGCPCCNTILHTFDICPRTTTMNSDLIYHFLVLLRGRRAPISTRRGYLQMAVERAPSGFYPWTRAFATLVEPDIFQTYDYSRDDPRALPVDPATRNRSAIVRNRRYVLELPVTDDQLNYLCGVYFEGGDSMDSSSSSSSSSLFLP
ncbi:uncharacterized protein F4807DRAFT_456736 [Annulohypoxylon truncatum]|uniref:uncharacterized protein n=1 Tax=Annulohypoxylon truncatum TaxID=327061 RepID=UPI002007FC31|nr:uncharacterized protein F4807DRAFT_456736 [Annulohypoxylon truncatum]KAI1213392.1 hypothetical protein F4807DRAFT_456736 [Annulohypoxylon truncatum]